MAARVGVVAVAFSPAKLDASLVPPIVILVADDEVLIADLLQIALEDAGFAVLVANDGDWAVAMLDDPTQAIAAVVTDINMGPGPDGWAVARHARELNPAMPVVYMTGAAAGEWPVLGVPHSILVSKPFVVDQIITALATLLNSGS